MAIETHRRDSDPLEAIQDAPPTLVRALAQHVELVEAGWWVEAIDRTIQFTLFKNRAWRDRRSIVKEVASILDAPRLDEPLISERIQELIQQSILVTHDNDVGLGAVASSEYERARAESDAMELACEERFKEVVRPIVPGEEWDRFKAGLLYPLVAELGARTIELLRGQSSIPKTRASEEYLSRHEINVRVRLQDAVVEFLDPQFPPARQFILSYLTHYMLVASSGADRETLNELRETRKNAVPEFDVLLDTNVVFSLLDLHFNPANEAAQSFLSLVQSTGEHVVVRMYVLRDTLDEALHALKTASDNAPRNPVSGNVALAVQSSGQVSGLVGRYFDYCASVGSIAPSAYFGPYISGLDLMLTNLGVSIIDSDEDLVELRESSIVEQRTNDWMSFEYGKAEGRSREQVHNDVLAMEFVGKRRQGRPLRISEAKWWFLTVDFVLQNYEKRGLQGNLGAPRSINPAELVQLLRFWIPRSDRLESAILGGIRLPFSFFFYDKRTEKTCLRIADRLGQYANIDSLSPEAVGILFADESVLAAFSNANDASLQAKTLDSAMAEIAARSEQHALELEKKIVGLEKQLTDTHEKLQSISTVTSGKEKSKQKLMDERDRLARELAAEREKTKSSRANQSAEVADLRRALTQIKAEADGARDAHAKLERRVATLVCAALSLLICAAVLSGIYFVLAALHPNVWGKLAIAVIATGVALAAISLVARKSLTATDGRLRRSIVVATTQLWGWIGAGVVAVVFTFVVAPPGK